MNKPEAGSLCKEFETIVCKCGELMRVMMASKHQITAYHCQQCGTAAVRDPRFPVHQRVDWYDILKEEEDVKEK